jgi:hypothetical protein
MPVKLPAPDLGTAEQAGPKSVVAVDEPLADGDEEGDDADDDDDDDDAGLLEEDAAVEDPDELHAATLRARPAPRAETTIR